MIHKLLRRHTAKEDTEVGSIWDNEFEGPVSLGGNGTITKLDGRTGKRMLQHEVSDEGHALFPFSGGTHVAFITPHYSAEGYKSCTSVLRCKDLFVVRQVSSLVDFGEPSGFANTASLSFDRRWMALGRRHEKTMGILNLENMFRDDILQLFTNVHAIDAVWMPRTPELLLLQHRQSTFIELSWYNVATHTYRAHLANEAPHGVVPAACTLLASGKAILVRDSCSAFVTARSLNGRGIWMADQQVFEYSTSTGQVERHGRVDGKSALSESGQLLFASDRGVTSCYLLDRNAVHHQSHVADQYEVKFGTTEITVSMPHRRGMLPLAA